MSARPADAMPPQHRAIAVDGHDGAGKSTIARLLADRLGGRYVRPFAPPIGEQLSALADEARWDLVAAQARAACEDALAAAAGRPVVFDRHWPTICAMAMTRGHAWDAAGGRWADAPPAFICWTDLDTTAVRHRRRGEGFDDAPRHQRYVAAFRDLAARHGLPLLDTTSTTADAAAGRVLAWLTGTGDLGGIACRTS